jgi:hypothetical protein
METREDGYEISAPLWPSSKVNPKELMSAIAEYLKYGYDKSQIKVDQNSSKIINISFVDAKTLMAVWTIGGYIKIKVDIPETKYAEIYEAKDWTPMMPNEAMAYAIHGVTRRIIDDPIIQDYILCR